MNYLRSYKIKDFSTNVEGEVNRLRSQVDLFWPKELRAYRQFGLEDGMRVLECGSGPGHVLDNLLREFPGCRATAVEIDPYLVGVLKERLGGRCEISQQSIMDLGFAAESFDFVITRLVLEHLPDPLGAAREVLRVLAPGGRAVFVDNDFAMHLRTHPEIPELTELYDAYCRLRVAEGGNPRIGRELPSLLRACGFGQVDLEVVCAHSSVTGDDMFLKSEGVGIPSQLVKEGYLPATILDRLAVKWHRVLRHEQHSIFRQLFVSGGEKPLVASHGVPVRDLGPGGADPAGRVPHPRISGRVDRQQILSALPQARLSVLQAYVAGYVADALDVPMASLGAETRVNDLGFDSLMAVDVIDGIESELGVCLSLMDFFEGQSLQEITSLLHGRLFPREAGAPEDNGGKSPSGPADDDGTGRWEEGEL